MKNFSILVILCLACSIVQAQFVYKIKADSVLITNDSCTAELILENSTKNIKGFLYNRGNGRTEFKKGVIKVNDSTYVFGDDTLNIAGSGLFWKLIGNTGTDPSTNFLGTIDSVDLIIKTKALENARFRAAGGLVFRNSAGLDKVDINKNGTGYLNINHRFGQGEGNYFTDPLTVSVVMDSAHKMGRGNTISGSRVYASVNGTTINPTSLDGSSVFGFMSLRMKKGDYSFFTDVIHGFPTAAVLGHINIASSVGGDSTTKYTFYGNSGGINNGLSAFCSRMDFNWSPGSNNYGAYNSYLSVPVFPGQTGRYTENFNHFAASRTYIGSGSNGKIGTIAGLYIENLKTDSVNRAWGVLQLGTNDWNAFRGNVMIGDTTIAGNYKLDVVKAQTGLAAEGRVINASTQGATFNTTSSTLSSYGGYFNSNATRASGSNDLTNIGLFATASGAQVNLALKTDGNVNMTNLPTTTDTTSYKPIGVNSSGDVAKVTGWPPAVNYSVQTLTDGATITWNAANGINAIVTLGGTGRTLSITNPVAGMTYTIRIIQDGTGSRTITTWPTNSKWPSGTSPTLSTVANRYDIVVFYYDGTNYYGTYQQNFQ